MVKHTQTIRRRLKGFWKKLFEKYCILFFFFFLKIFAITLWFNVLANTFLFFILLFLKTWLYNTFFVSLH